MIDLLYSFVFVTKKLIPHGPEVAFHLASALGPVGGVCDRSIAFLAQIIFNWRLEYEHHCQHKNAGEYQTS